MIRLLLALSGFFFTPKTGDASIDQFRAGDSLVLAPGDGLSFVHWCYPPDSYAFWVIVDYTQ